MSKKRQLNTDDKNSGTPLIKKQKQQIECSCKLYEKNLRLKSKNNKLLDIVEKYQNKLQSRNRYNSL